MKDLMDLTLINVQSVSVRAVAGHGDQAELQIQTARGSLNVRLIAQRGRSIRVTDLRSRDKRKKPLLTPAMVHKRGAE